MKTSDHSQVVNRIAREMKLDPDQVDTIVRAFFSRYGIRKYLRHAIPVKIKYFGTFYFHKKTMEVQQRIEKYNKNIKQYNYRRKQLNAKKPEFIILSKFINK